MISWMGKRLNKEDGFTLVELMVVVLIIAILIAIAIPTFLGARERAQDRAAQSNLRNALTSAKVHYTDEEAYTTAGAATTVTEAELEAIEPSLDFVLLGAAAAADDANAVHFIAEEVAVGEGLQQITFYNAAASGNTFCLRDVATTGGALAVDAPGTYYGSSTLAVGDIQTFNAAVCIGDEW